VLKIDCIYSSQLISIGTNPQEKQYVVIRDVKTRYILWPGIKYPMYSLQSKSDSIITFPDVLKLDYIYSSQLISIGTNPEAKQNVLIRDVKTGYILWPGIKYPTYSFQSKSDSIIFIPRCVKARLYIYSSQLISIGTNPQAKQNVVILDVKTRYML
jgi:hypothetical protein